MELEEYSLVKRAIKKILDIDLDYYKDQQMRRRLDSWLVRSNAGTWEQYFNRIRVDKEELSRFRNYLTINVSSFFRDKERWQSLRETVLLQLLKEALTKRAGGGMRIWSAGCSIGPEPYTLTMILDEMSGNRKHYLLATDLDRGALAKAKAGGPYVVEDIQNLSQEQRSVYLEPGGPPFYVSEKLRKRIDFREQNMITEPFDMDFDLIVCRNVVIYFTSETKDELYKKFYAALRPGGVLFVGATEIIPRPQEIGFRTQGVSFYVKTP